VSLAWLRGATGGRGEYVLARKRLVERLAAAGVRDPRVLQAFGEVPRHRLIPEALRAAAYRDTPLPIGDGQTISAPGVVAVMTQALALSGPETVLEVGTGSGYQAAILSRLATRVVSIERLPRLAARARSALDALGVANVVVHLGDGTQGRPAEAPYQAIVVTAGGPEVPDPLLAQLAPGGRLVGPFGPRGGQELLRVQRRTDGRLVRERLGSCSFVDLIGTHGWAA
jgi:protein-L-isoaspartate(D-aspartate) O-methyltransferase